MVLAAAEVTTLNVGRQPMRILPLVVTPRDYARALDVVGE
jgi:hypothetical protein